MKFKSHQAAFTLIELLVVISIISLLSSVVLASVKDARTKAQQKAFRQEVGQFVNALELYRADNGYYPGQETGYSSYYFYIENNEGIQYSEYPDDYNYPTKMQKYIPKFPTPPTELSSFYYYASSLIRCEGEKTTPPYVLLISTQEEGFDDWGYYEYDTSNNGEYDLYNEYHCFSLK